jgi:hypothetical protein
MAGVEVELCGERLGKLRIRVSCALPLDFPFRSNSFETTSVSVVFWLGYDDPSAPVMMKRTAVIVQKNERQALPTPCSCPPAC